MIGEILSSRSRKLKANSYLSNARSQVFGGEQWQLYLDRKTHPSRWIPWAASSATHCRRRRTALMKCCTVILIPSTSLLSAEGRSEACWRSGSWRLIRRIAAEFLYWRVGHL